MRTKMLFFPDVKVAVREGTSYTYAFIWAPFIWDEGGGRGSHPRSASHPLAARPPARSRIAS